MTTSPRSATSMLVLAVAAAACSPSPRVTTAPTVGPTIGALPVVTTTPTQAGDYEPLILGSSEVSLKAGTYRWMRTRPGIEFPLITFTVGDGWGADGRFTFKRRTTSDDVQVAMQFWDVGQVYGHPCKWQGTLFDPGPTVDDLAAALVDVPLRNASQPVGVTLDGYAGTYLEWSVPADLEMDAEGNFVDCDSEPGKAERYFESWIGDPNGWGGDRYHQAPGQVDRLWILDVDGVRFVIDAFSLPTATEEEVNELLAVVSSIEFQP
jgi:hypothetical protein